MAIDIVNNPANGIPLDPSQRPAADREEIKRLAQEFEAMLMTQMLREMRQSMVDEDEDKEDGFGASTMMDTADIAVGQALSRAKGVGLSDSLIKAFERQLGTPSADPATVAAHIARLRAGETVPIERIESLVAHLGGDLLGGDVLRENARHFIKQRLNQLFGSL